MIGFFACLFVHRPAVPGTEHPSRLKTSAASRPHCLGAQRPHCHSASDRAFSHFDQLDDPAQATSHTPEAPLHTSVSAL